MKTEITDTGWKEITEIKIVKILEKQSTTIYLSSCEISFLHYHGNACNCCGKNWRGMAGNVNLVKTNHGEKTICDKCVVKIFAGEKNEIQL